MLCTTGIQFSAGHVLDSESAGHKCLVTWSSNDFSKALFPTTNLLE